METSVSASSTFVLFAIFAYVTRQEWWSVKVYYLMWGFMLAIPFASLLVLIDRLYAKIKGD